MSESGTTSIAEGIEALRRLRAEISESSIDFNEAETRFQIIDRIIVDCLGWPRDRLRLEQHCDRSYTDYELGDPRCVIWEAKRESQFFEMPANPKGDVVQDLRSVMALDEKISKAIKQVHEYCVSRGVELAVATNGHQLVAFLATRSDGVPPLDGRCFVISGFEKLESEFPKVWQMLSPAGVAERRLNRLLSVGEEKALPQKLSSMLTDHPQHRYSSDLNTSLRTLSELLLIDVVDQEEAEKQFYKECYCQSGALSQHALISKKMLAERYSSLFDKSESAPTVTPVKSRDTKEKYAPELLTEAISKRPIVLIGDVGVGKTSFMKHLMYIEAPQEFDKAIYIYIDLGSQGALATDLVEFILSEIEVQLHDKYGVDVYKDEFVRGVYNAEILRFGEGIYKSLLKQNKSAYNMKLLDFLEEKTKDRNSYLRHAILHIAKGRKNQVVFVIDNADQRDDDVQQGAFIVAQNFAKSWEAIVFIAVRPQTFFRSKQAGALTAYPHRVFTISPPRVDLVIEKRLSFALDMAEGRIPIERLEDVRVNLGNIASFLKALKVSLSKRTEMVEFLSNITAGNIRAVVEFVAKFIGSANVDAKKIIEIMDSTGTYLIPVHEFWKAALLGEYSYYDPKSSLALNLFDIENAKQSEHFLLPMILGFLGFDSDHKSKEGFALTNSIIVEMQSWGFTPNATRASLRRANNKKLLEAPERITFNEDESGLIGDMPERFRITTIGAYHQLRWIADFSYLDAMSYDTPILEEEVRNELGATISSFNIEDRYNRALLFRQYITKAWHSSNLAPRYFDWSASITSGDESFSRVKRAIDQFS